MDVDTIASLNFTGRDKLSGKHRQQVVVRSQCMGLQIGRNGVVTGMVRSA